MEEPPFATVLFSKILKKKKKVQSSTKRKNRLHGQSILTRIASCIKSIAIRRPNNSPARRVNLLIMEHAPKMARMKSKMAVQTQTL